MKCLGTETKAGKDGRRLPIFFGCSVLEKFAEIAYNLEKDETTRRASPF